MITETTYRIKYNGHTWTTTCADTAQEFAEKGGTVTAETKRQNQQGIKMAELSTTQLQELNRIAIAENWNQISDMAGREIQRQVEQ